MQTDIKVKVPPLKIQGIKTKLVPFIMRAIDWEGEGKWVEPFLGSGVVMFNVNPEKAIGADSNPHIISVYKSIQDRTITPSSMRSFLEEEGARLEEIGEDYYYSVRDRFNENHSPFDYLFLNRSCFNGMMRFNSNREFNVPFCRKPERFSKSYITRICNQIDWLSKRMDGKDWIFKTQDWTNTLDKTKSGDFVYLDPPYNSRHSGYYNEWDEEESEKLVEYLNNLNCGFAYSTWKENKHRENDLLKNNFDQFRVVTKEHFYHVGSKEKYRNSMEEALVIPDEWCAKNVNDSILVDRPDVEKQYGLFTD
jgi:DNA adenine methylase